MLCTSSRMPLGDLAGQGEQTGEEVAQVVGLREQQQLRQDLRRRTAWPIVQSMPTAAPRSSGGLRGRPRRAAGATSGQFVDRRPPARRRPARGFRAASAGRRAARGRRSWIWPSDSSSHSARSNVSASSLPIRGRRAVPKLRRGSTGTAGGRAHCGGEEYRLRLRISSLQARQQRGRRSSRRPACAACTSSSGRLGGARARSRRGQLRQPGGDGIGQRRAVAGGLDATSPRTRGSSVSRHSPTTRAKSCAVQEIGAAGALVPGDAQHRQPVQQPALRQCLGRLEQFQINRPRVRGCSSRSCRVQLLLQIDAPAAAAASVGQRPRRSPRRTACTASRTADADAVFQLVLDERAGEPRRPGRAARPRSLPAERGQAAGRRLDGDQVGRADRLLAYPQARRPCRSSGRCGAFAALCVLPDVLVEAGLASRRRSRSGCRAARRSSSSGRCPAPDLGSGAFVSRLPPPAESSFVPGQPANPSSRAASAAL